MSSRPTAIAQATGVILCSRLAGVLAKLALRDVAPFTFVWLQIAIGGVLLTVYTFAIRKERLPKGIGLRAWLHIAGMATMVVGMALVQLRRRSPT